jgi:hypothetical protein
MGREWGSQDFASPETFLVTFLGALKGPRSRKPGSEAFSMPVPHVVAISHQRYPNHFSTRKQLGMMICSHVFTCF